MTLDELRPQIAAMEALESVLKAIEEISGVELEPGEKPQVDIRFSTTKDVPIAGAYAIPNAVALYGLRAMQRMLEQMLVKETA